MDAVTTPPTDPRNAVARLKPLVAFNAVLGVGGGGWPNASSPSTRPTSAPPPASSPVCDDLGPPTFWDGLVA